MRPGPLGILERVVERQARHVEARGCSSFSSRIGASCRGPAVVPRQHVADGDRRPSASPRSTSAAQILGGRLDRPALRDVVDPALHDQHLGARDRLVEPRGDLVGALAPDAVVQERELRVPQAGPVLPLPFRVAARARRESQYGEPSVIESPRQATTVTLEEELPPRRPPVVGARGDLARAR